MLARAFSQLIIEGRLSEGKLLDALRKYHLLPLLPSILEDLKHHEKELRVRDIVHIESPFSVDDKNIKAIKKLMNVEDKIHDFTLNKSLLAGFKARHKGRMVDGSMERVLKDFINK